MERSIVIFIVNVMFVGFFYLCISSFRNLFVRNNKSVLANDAFSLRSFLSSDDLVASSANRTKHSTYT